MALPQPPHRFGALDAAFLNFESKEMPLHIGGVCVFEGAIPFNRFVATIESKLDLIPRYRQKVMRPFLNIGYPTWQYDPDFDIRRHIFHVQLDPPGSDEQLSALAGRIFTPLLDRNKPLWETYVVDGLSGGRSALICKVHHCIVDGVAGIGLMNVMLDATPKERRLPKRKPFHPPAPPDAASLFMDAFTDSLSQIPKRLADTRDALRGYGNLLRRDDYAAVGLERVVDMMPELLSPLEHLPFNRTCSGERRVYWTEFPMAEAHAIKTAHGCTLNDVVLTVVAGAVAKYTEAHGQTTKNRFFRPMVPVNVRPAEQAIGAFGNLISLLTVSLPLGIRDPIERLEHIHELTQAMKGARTPELLRLSLAWLGILPPPVQAFLASNLGWLNTPIPLFHMVCTNVPGPQIPLYTCGQRMTACYPHVPTGMDVGISVAIESYDGKLYFALTTDALAAPDGGSMIGLLEASFQELREAAGIAASVPERKAKPKARKAAKRPPKAKPAPAAVEAAAQPPEPDVTVLLSEGTAEEETLEDATLVLEEELEPAF
ncbi:MAG: wax ester/triacylglycerol synthase family O-acyltransferase [Bryobacteraceae bacterium]